MGKSKIEWLMGGKSWNPIQDKIKGPQGRGYHCTKVSPGCAHCYAEGINRRFGNRLPFDGREAAGFEIVETERHAPSGWKKTCLIFVMSMGDLFHKDIPDTLIHQVLHAAELAPQHTYIFLTKRPERQRDIINNHWQYSSVRFPNWWFMTTACNQEEADRNIPFILQTTAAVRGVSVEPMLGLMDSAEYLGYWRCACGSATDCTIERLAEYRDNGSILCDDCDSEMKFIRHLDWVICGGETGPGAKPLDPIAVRGLRDQCVAAGVPFFFKSWGEYIPEYDAGYRSDDKDAYGKTFGARWANTRRFCHRWPDGSESVRVGKKFAGRLLDGRTWDELPGGLSK